MLRSSADLQLYDSEFQTEGALTMKAFADNVSAIRATESKNLSDDRNVRAGLLTRGVRLAKNDFGSVFRSVLQKNCVFRLGFGLLN